MRARRVAVTFCATFYYASIQRTANQLKFLMVAASMVVGGVLVIGRLQSADSSVSTSAPKALPSPAAGAGDTIKGGAIYRVRCASCHGAAGVGVGIGPSLKGETSRKDRTAVIGWIKNPQPPMPKLYPSPLTDQDVTDVAAYVESL